MTDFKKSFESLVEPNEIFIDKIFSFLFLLYSCLGILRSTNIDIEIIPILFRYTQLLCLALIGFISIYNLVNKRIKFNFLLFLLFLSGIVNFIVTKHTFVIAFTILFISFGCVNFDKMLKKLVFLMLAILFIVIILSFLGVIRSDITYREGGRTRNSLGFSAVTLPLTILMFSYLGFIYIYKKKYTFIAALFFGASAYFLYKQTLTRTGFYLIWVIIAFAILNRIFNVEKLFFKLLKLKVINFIYIMFPLIILVVDFYLIYLYNLQNDLSFRLDYIFTTRLSLTSNLIKVYGLNLFGSNIPQVDVYGNYFQSDICYLFYGLNYGLLFLGITIFLECYMLYIGYKTKDIYLIFVIFLSVVDGMFEPYLLDYKYQIFAFLLSGYLLTDKGKLKLELRRLKIL